MNNAIPEFDPIESLSKERLRRTVLTQIPDSLRGEIWMMICQVKREKAMHAPGFYQKLLTLDNMEDEHRIQKDVTRTFSNYPVSGQDEDNDTSWNHEQA